MSARKRAAKKGSAKRNGVAAPGEKLTVALCQIRTEEWARDGNLSRTLDALDDAAGAAELAITPECVLHGYPGRGGMQRSEYAERMLAIAETVDGPSVSAVREKAGEHGMEVVLGFVERDGGGNVHNTAVLIGTAGEILMKYRKVHCRPFESVRHEGAFVPGDEFAVLDRAYAGAAVKLGVMICFDREVAESVRCLRALGAELIACPLACDTSSCTAASVHAHNEMITRVRAAENEVSIAVVNHSGRFNGGSFAVGPKGGVLAQMGKAPGVEIVEIPVGRIRDEFRSKPLGWMGWGHRRPEVYGSCLGA